jgi:phage-related protein
MRVIDLLEQFGPGLQRPHAASIRLQRYSGLWELRISFSGDASRVFYFTLNDGSFVLLHGFIKKTEKLPKKELEIALNRKQDFLKRCEK